MLPCAASPPFSLLVTADIRPEIVRFCQDGVDQVRITSSVPAALRMETASLTGWNYVETSLAHVNAGNLIVTEFINVTTQDMFWDIAGLNEIAGGSHASHLWSYGLNT